MVPVELNPIQKQAIRSEGNAVVTAGAGSGKTLVLVEHYLYLLLSRPQLSTRNIVAITFTKKAASEMKDRVRLRLNELLAQPESQDRQEHLTRIKDDLHLAYISTIHALCARILRESPLEADVDPNFSTLEALDATLLVREVIAKAFQDFAALPPDNPRRRALTFLATHWGRKPLDNALEEMMQKRPVVRRWLDAYRSKSEEEILAHWTTLAAEMKKPPQPTTSFNHLAITALKELAVLFPAIAASYEARKRHGVMLDFEDLLEKTLHLLSTAHHVRDQLAAQFHTILVDEFQDTDPLQWKILRQLVTTNGSIQLGKIFIVGDPKQSIYGFRNADMRIFYRLRREIIENLPPTDEATSRNQPSQSPSMSRSSPADLPMNINYRSLPAIINLVNFVFGHIMSPSPQSSTARSLEYGFEVEYQPLDCDRAKSEPGHTGQVELFLIPKPTSPELLSGTEDLTEREAELIARRIQALVPTNPAADTSSNAADSSFHKPVKYGDIAILLRQRTHLQTYETALRRYDIPYLTVGGVGFFQRQELLDLYNLLEFLTMPHNDLALTGLLRSPLCGFSDCLLMKIAERAGRTMWEKLQAAEQPSPELFSAEEQRVLRRALENLRHLMTLSQRMPPSRLLITALDHTGAWASLAAGPEGEQRLANVDKLLTLARSFESAGFVSLVDFLERLRLLVDRERYEGEAPIEFETRNAVKIMTIHKAKGLEFPVVFVPGLQAQFSYARYTALLIDDDYGLGMKLCNPEKSFKQEPTSLHNYIYERQRQKVKAEEKRLFYVAMTRAKNHLVLSATVNDFSKIRQNSWLAWLVNRLNLTQTELNQKHTTFTYNNQTFSMPIYTTPDDFVAQPRPPAAGPAAYELVQAQLAEPIAESDIPAHTRTAIQHLAPLKQEPLTPSYAVTQLLAFSRCPLNYYFKYVLGASDSIISAAVSQAPDQESQRSRLSAMLRGTLVHQAFESMHLPAMRDRPAYIRNMLASYPDLPESERSALSSLIIDALNRFEQSNLGRTILASSHRLHEAGFQLMVNRTAVIRGKADLLFQNPHSHWEVVDFKTDVIQPKELDRAAAPYMLQLELYALFASRLYPAQDSYQAHLYFTHIADAFTKTFDQRALGKIETELAARIQELTQFHATLRTPDALHSKTLIDNLKMHCQACDETRRSRCAFFNP